MCLISEMLAFATQLLTMMTHSNRAKSIPKMHDLLLKVAYIYLLRHAFTSNSKSC